jgi:hypothetical protein
MQQQNYVPPQYYEEPFDWSYEIDDDEWAQFCDESNVQNLNVVDTTSQVFTEDWWEEEPVEFFADDFGNDDADLPQNDVWDHFLTDDDDYYVDDNYLNINYPGVLPVLVEDGWDQQHFLTDDDDYIVPDDYYNAPNPLLNVEDAWGTAFDDTPDLEDEYWWIENETDYQLVDNNPVITLEDVWDLYFVDDEDYDYDYPIIDD